MSYSRTKLILAFLIIIFPISITAQNFSEKEWYSGVLTLNEGEQLRGMIKYDLKGNLIQFSADGTIKTFSAGQFYTFTILMKKERLRRDFYVLPYKDSKGFERPMIFELMSEGTISLLAREHMVRSIASPGAKYGYGNKTIAEPDHQLTPNTPTIKYLDYNLFLADSEGNVTSLKLSKSNVIGALGRHQKKLKAYIKAENLKLRELPDLVELIEYFNELENL